jgi:hypothetical protein
MLLAIEEKRMKRRRDGTTNNLMMAQILHALTFKAKPKKFKRKC